MTDPDHDWMDTLAGRTPTDSSRGTIREAERLRDFIQRNVHAPDVDIPGQDTQREAQLLERARREGLIDPVELTKRSRRPVRPAAVRALIALAAAVAGIAVALGVFLHGAPQTEHFRGPREEVIRIQSANPTALKMQILDELRAAGVRATGYEQLGVAGIDASLPEPVPPHVRKVLTRHRLAVPGNGVLRVEIAAPATP